MKKVLIFIFTMIIWTVLVACTGDSEEVSNEDAVDNKENQSEKNNDGQAAIPEDIIIDAEADPIELKDQMGLEIGDTGYTVTQGDYNELAITLNGVEMVRDIGKETESDDALYLIGDFTFKNLSDGYLTIEKPDAARGSDEEAIENDELGNNGDLLGIGDWFVDENNEIPLEENPTNSMSLEKGEVIDQKISIIMRDRADEYMIVFGFFDGNNKDYRNKVTWTFDADKVVEK